LFFSVPPGKYRDNALNKTTNASFHILSNSSCINHPTVCDHRCWQRLK
jgi:hypothetical protein